MGVRDRSSIYIGLALIISVLLVSVPSAAIVAELTEGNLTDSQNEGELIRYTITVSGIPKQALYIGMKTDLTAVPDTPLWQFAGSGFTIKGGDDADNDRTITLEMRDEGDIKDYVNVTVTGRAPVLTSVEIVDGVVVTKRNTQTTGYLYYRIEALDENQDLLGTGTTETFSVTIPDDEVFRTRLNAVRDPEMRELIDDLYSRGLRDEANDLLTYAEVPKDATIALTMAVLLAVLLLIVGFAAGMVFGRIRAKNMQEFQNDYKGE